VTEPLKLVSHKAWFIPANRRTYKALKSIGFPTTRIHKASLSILKMVLVKHGYRAYVEPFSKIQDSFLDAATDWCARNGYRCSTSSTTQSFRFPNTKSGRDHATKIERKIKDFWTRWGLSGDISVTESDKYVKVQAATSAATRNPVITVKNDAEHNKRNVLDLGTHRLMTSTDRRFLLWELEVKTGPDWRPLARGKHLLTEVSDPTGIIGDLMISFNTE